MMMFDDREKRNVIALSVLILFMLILFGPLFTVHSKYSGNEENNLNEVNSGQLQSKEDVNDNNVLNISFTGHKPMKKCSVSSGNLCFSKVFHPKPISKAECNNIKFNLGIKECGYDDDMWAGAVKKCGGVEHMATPEDLANLAQALYKLPDGSHSNIAPDEFYTGDAVFDGSKARSFGLSENGYIALWSNREVDGEIVSKPGEYVYGRNFFPTNSSWYPYERYGKSNKRLAVCVYKD